MSKENLQPRIQPKIVTLAAVRAGEQWLLYRRQRQPFVGKVGFPYGKLHVGESVVAAAERELREKTGVSAELVHAGDGYLLVRDSRGGVVSHMLMHIMVGELSEVVMLGDERHALQSCFWGHAAMLDDAMPGFSEILATVSVWKAGDARFFLELDVQG
jgi:ADP-ribose pyrophosphatase YjhB (NUDIX family)